MSRLRSRQKDLEPSRIDYALQRLNDLRFDVEFDSKNRCLRFEYKSNRITFFPYTGWFSGKGIQDGRGIHNLIKQLES